MARNGRGLSFKAWNRNPEANKFVVPLTMLSEQQFRVLKRFLVILYGPTSPRQDVNRARQSMFSQGTRSLGGLPATYAALAPVFSKAPETFRARKLEPKQNLEPYEYRAVSFTYSQYE